MKRIIKFRAWDKKKQKMFPVAHLDMALEEVILWTDKYKVNVNKNQWTDFRDIELMQFTGLTDKNGKEIYEGNIVKDNSIKNRGNTLVIVWNAKYMSFVGRREFGNNTYWDCELYDSLEKELEVIGNIYENKDLLK